MPDYMERLKAAAKKALSREEPSVTSAVDSDIIDADAELAREKSLREKIVDLPGMHPVYVPDVGTVPESVVPIMNTSKDVGTWARDKVGKERIDAIRAAAWQLKNKVKEAGKATGKAGESIGVYQPYEMKGMDVTGPGASATKSYVDYVRGLGPVKKMEDAAKAEVLRERAAVAEALEADRLRRLAEEEARRAAESK